MKIATLFSVLLILGLASAAPASSKENEVDDDILVIDEEFFTESLVLYTAEHDIVNIHVPLNKINFEEDTSSASGESNGDTAIFFVQADIKENGEKDYKGLYVLNKEKATKILDTGVDMAAESGDSTKVYIAAKDGLYVYEAISKEVKKYGTFSESLIGVAKENGTDRIWVLTEGKDIYKVTNDGTKNEKADDVKNVRQIVLDWSNNLFYIDGDNKAFVVTHGGIKEITGLPKAKTVPTLLRPPFILPDGVPVVIDNKSYLIFPNGTSEFGGIEFKVKPTAAAPEAAIIQVAAYNKKIYFYNLLEIILGEVLQELKTFLDDMKGDIQTIASKSKNQNQLFRR